MDEIWKCLKKLEGFVELKENWNSYGAPAISPKAIGCAKELLGLLSLWGRLACAEIDVAPTFAGGVMLEVCVELKAEERNSERKENEKRD